jgi:acyl-lipid omega-6 desaturase (Delta-12 desaturase)
METAAADTDAFARTSDIAPAPARVATHREGKELIDATRPYAEENRARSWAHVAETLGVLAFLLACAAVLPWWYARVAASVVAGLVVVRGFILFHDFQHGAILRGSKVAKVLFELFGYYVFTPSSVWKQTHNYHHAHTAQLVGSHIGSYMMLTVDMYERATPEQRRMYRITRHPLTMLFGYFTIFAWGMCVSPYLRDKKKHSKGPWVLAAHAVALALTTYFAGIFTTLTVLVIPHFVAFAVGSYLFYAQHNFPGMHVAPRETWSYTRAALESSSYTECSPLMAWFTGNIGYHHVHHLNSSIPFYRLPEAMEAIPELRDPIKTSLKPRDILACFRLKLWDPSRNEMVGYPD